MKKMRTVLVSSLFLLLIPCSAGAALAGNGPGVGVSLQPTPLAGNAGLENASGTAQVQMQHGMVIVTVDLGGAELPQGTVLEGWVVDAGLLGGPGETSASDDDEVYGTPFGDANFDMMVENAPYALSTGVLRRVGNGTYRGKFRIDNDLTPYDAVVITLESDGNGVSGGGAYDPRPGTPVLAGEI